MNDTRTINIDEFSYNKKDLILRFKRLWNLQNNGVLYHRITIAGHHKNVKFILKKWNDVDGIREYNYVSECGLFKAIIQRLIQE